MSINVKEIDFHNLKDMRELEWNLRKVLKNSDVVCDVVTLGNASHRETHYSFKAPEEERFGYLSFESLVNDKFKTLRFGYIYVFELKLRVFINELPFNDENVIYPDGMIIYRDTTEIDHLVNKETGIDLKAQNNIYAYRT